MYLIIIKAIRLVCLWRSTSSSTYISIISELYIYLICDIDDASNNYLLYL